MSRSASLVMCALLATVPISVCAAQRMVIRSAERPACAGAQSTDLTIYDVEEVSSRPVLRSAPNPVYPPALREARVNGSVTLAFVVNADGLVDSATVTVLAATDSAFTLPARTTIVGSVYWPACRAGAPVRAQLSQRISFESKE